MKPELAKISGAMIPAAPSIAHREWITSLYFSHEGSMKPPVCITSHVNTLQPGTQARHCAQKVLWSYKFVDIGQRRFFLS